MAELLEWMMQADQMLGEFISRYGNLVYLFLFLIIFVETGLVVIAFFPGDGLLFSAGLFAAAGSLELAVLLPLLSVATIAGNTSNYYIGRYLGHRFFQKKDTVWARQLRKAHQYHERYGPWAVALSRFFPFMRTLVPFAAGLTRMSFRLFTPYNILGGMAWICAYVLAGFFFGGVPWVKRHYGLIFSGLILFLLLVLIYGIGKAFWDRRRRAGD
ncbi:MAG: VTT domain-containing protein [Phaeodactylibacter sp.]|nr:VTT domain-containing protein [Phaeodactylibacter sp.]MCB9292955.1 VTT domain-containing protein [Lewinellaceae bacterium]